MNKEKKYNELKRILLKFQGQGLFIAYSGGMDSTYLLQAAVSILGPDVTAITFVSAVFPRHELLQAQGQAQRIGAEHHLLYYDIFSHREFVDNPPQRCYICKKVLFSVLIEAARARKIINIADGTNVDDLKDNRPGLRALAELGIKSPLLEAKMTKNDIREWSRELGLATWNQPPSGCLATRIPYHQTITPEKLTMIDNAEQYLRQKGFVQVRVRHHGDIARIEVGPKERKDFFDPVMMDEINAHIKALGFLYVALDLSGYRSHNNEAVNK